LTWPVTRVQSTVWPDSGGQGGDELALGATVALPERVRHVGHVVQPREAGGVLGLGHGAELVGGGNRLGHDLHRLADGLRRQERFALGDVDGADLAGPLVDVLEQVTVDGAQAIEVVRRRDAVAGHRQRPNLDCLVLALTQLLLRRRTDVVAQNPGVLMARQAGAGVEVAAPPLVLIAHFPRLRLDQQCGRSCRARKRRSSSSSISPRT